VFQSLWVLSDFVAVPVCKLKSDSVIKAIIACFGFQVRTKLAVNRTSPAPGAATQKADAANQTKPQAVSPASQTQQMAGAK
jgi:hypothetical protein